MLHTLRIASAAAFLSVAIVAALAHPGAAVARVLDSTDAPTVTTTVSVAGTATARHHATGRIIELPTVTVVGHVHHDAAARPRVDTVASTAESLPRQVGEALPHLRFDMPYYSFGVSTRGSTASASE